MPIPEWLRASATLTATAFHVTGTCASATVDVPEFTLHWSDNTTSIGGGSGSIVGLVATASGSVLRGEFEGATFRTVLTGVPLNPLGCLDPGGLKGFKYAGNIGFNLPRLARIHRRAGWVVTAECPSEQGRCGLSRARIVNAEGHPTARVTAAAVISTTSAREKGRRVRGRPCRRIRDCSDASVLGYARFVSTGEWRTSWTTAPPRPDPTKAR